MHRRDINNPEEQIGEGYDQDERASSVARAAPEETNEDETDRPSNVPPAGSADTAASAIKRKRQDEHGGDERGPSYQTRSRVLERVLEESSLLRAAHMRQSAPTSVLPQHSMSGQLSQHRDVSNTGASLSALALLTGAGTVRDSSAALLNPLVNPFSSQDPRILESTISNLLLQQAHQAAAGRQQGLIQDPTLAGLALQQQRLLFPGGSIIPGAGSLRSLPLTGTGVSRLPTNNSSILWAAPGTAPLLGGAQPPTLPAAATAGATIGQASQLGPAATALTLQAYQDSMVRQQPLELSGLLYGRMVPGLAAPVPTLAGLDAAVPPRLAATLTVASNVGGTSSVAAGLVGALALSATAGPLPSRKLLFMPCDQDRLSDYQCLIRKNIELFAARVEDTETGAQGRNKAIVLGQVGIRCIHCSAVHPRRRARGATYYPSKLEGLYQAAQNMASCHLCTHCSLVPTQLRQELLVLRDRKSSAGGGKRYWADGLRALGIMEDPEGNGLKFVVMEAIEN